MIAKSIFRCAAVFALLCSNIATAQEEQDQMDGETRFMQLALDCVQREYPNKVSHVLQGDSDALPPRALHPAFYGCYDWHSAVHGHWLLVRLLRSSPESELAAAATAALDANLTPQTIAGEVAYFRGEGGRPSSVPTVLPGCYSSASNCANGTIPVHHAGPKRSRRWRRKSPTGIAAGCPICSTRSASGRITSPPSVLLWLSTGRGRRGIASSSG